MPSYVLVWLLLIFAWAANFAVRIGFSALLPSIMDELQLSYTRAGLLASAFFYAYATMQLPSGLLGDRFGRRRILLLGLLGGALSAGLTGLAGSFGALFVARALTGAFQEQVTDVSLPGTGVGFDFTRSYTSSDATAGRLGPGWTDSLAASLQIQGNGDVIVHAEDGQQVYFTKQVDGSYIAEPGTLKKDSTYGAALRMRLDTSQLPRPFQITAVGSRDWNIGSDWYRWTVAP